jgi:iron complex transport system substrate-binding protein
LASTDPAGASLRKVTSLFPSATEIVFAIGAGEQLVGVSHDCDHPPEAAERKAVTKQRFDPEGLTSAEIYREKAEVNKKFGSVYRLDETGLWGLMSNVIITQGPSDFSLVSLPGIRAIAEGLNPRPELVILYPRHLDDVFDDFSKVGFAVGRLPEARALLDQMNERIAAVEEGSRGKRQPRVAFVQWMDPSFSGGYWIPQMIGIAGGADVLNTAGLSPSRFEWNQLRAYDPDIVVIACEDLSIDRVRWEAEILFDRPGWKELSAVKGPVRPASFGFPTG